MKRRREHGSKLYVVTVVLRVFKGSQLSWETTHGVQIRYSKEILSDKLIYFSVRAEAKKLVSFGIQGLTSTH